VWFEENTRNPAEFRVLSVANTTEHALQKRISGEDFSLSKSAGRRFETVGKISTATH